MEARVGNLEPFLQTSRGTASFQGALEHCLEIIGLDQVSANGSP